MEQQCWSDGGEKNTADLSGPAEKCLATIQQGSVSKLPILFIDKFYPPTAPAWKLAEYKHPNCTKIYWKATTAPPPAQTQHLAPTRLCSNQKTTIPEMKLQLFPELAPPPIPREQAGLLLGYLAKAETNQRFPEMQISETIYIKDFHLRKYRFV